MIKFTPVTSDAFREYYLTEDTEKQVKFKLGYFTNQIKLHLEKELKSQLKKYNVELSSVLRGETDSSDFYLAQVFIMFVRYGLVGWEGMVNQNNEPIEFTTEEIDIPFVGKRKVASDSIISGLQLLWVAELGREIIDMNYTTAAERKN